MSPAVRLRPANVRGWGRELLQLLNTICFQLTLPPGVRLERMEKNMANVIGIAVRPEVDAPMATVNETTLREESGVHGDYQSGRGPRQVTVLFKDNWDAACAEVGADLAWTTRRANIFVDGMTLDNCKGLQLEIGGAILEVTGETLPCNIMEDAQSGLRAALGKDWRGGVTCRVMQTGAIAVGSTVLAVESSLA